MDLQNREIDKGIGYIGFQEASERVKSNMHTLGSEELPLESSLNRIAAEPLDAAVHCPSTDISLKDGFALNSEDISAASKSLPTTLKVIGSAYAGMDFAGGVGPGRAVRICSGARIPSDTNAVVASEFCEEIPGKCIRVYATADAGRNILHAGGEVEKGTPILRRGDMISPRLMGLGAAAGIKSVKVFRHPRVAIIAIGDEIVVPGSELKPGQVYASNLVTLKAWLQAFGIGCSASVVRDNASAIRSELEIRQTMADVILTSGGAWGSERDLIVGILSELGWKEEFHHVRMGPGKGVSFGLWNEKPVFCLPGGPASNEMAFLQLAMPGILKTSGAAKHPLPSISAILTEDVPGRQKDWAEFKNAVLSQDSENRYTAGVFRNGNRLQSTAGANAIICIPEGRDTLLRGEQIPVQLLI